jgi:hypothetical protein
MGFPGVFLPGITVKAAAFATFFTTSWSVYMPLTTEVLPYRYRWVNKSIYGSVQIDRSEAATFTKWSMTKPSTTWRLKPTDLWLGGTSRAVISTVYNDSFGYIVDDYKQNEYYGRAISSAYGFSSRRAPPGVVQPDFGTMHNQLRNELRGQAVNLAMALAEYNKTAALFSNAARFVATKGRGLGRGFAGTKKASRTIAKRYLEFQYGVKPLCNDMIGSYNELKNAAMRPMVLKGSVKRKTSGTHRYKYSSGSSVYTALADAESTLRYFSKVSWRAVLNPDGVKSTLTRNGFSNPLALAWELVPYSFVVDWWINIGEVLASLDNLLLVQSLRARNSYRKEFGTYVTVANKNGNGSYSWIEVETNRSDTSPLPLTNVFRYKPSVSKQHILNGLALLRVAKRD